MRDDRHVVHGSPVRSERAPVRDKRTTTRESFEMAFDIISMSSRRRASVLTHCTQRALSRHECIIKRQSSFRATPLTDERSSIRLNDKQSGLALLNDPQPGVVRESYPRTAMCVRSVDVHVSCSSQVDAQLAAFFIDPRAK